MNTKQVIQSQYLAALAMLKQAIAKCPQALWDAPGNQDEFWRKSYHTLFYVHLYLQNAEKDFVPWEKHHDPDGDVPFTKDEVLEYLSFVEKQVLDRVPTTDLDENQVSTGTRSINWNCSSSTSGTSSNMQVNCTNDWEHMKILNLAGKVSAIIRSKND